MSTAWRRSWRATRAIAERCTFTLADLGYRFPSFPVPEGESEQGLLERLSWRGVEERYAIEIPAPA